MIQDMVEIVECRALQDLKWKARLQLSNGVFLIGKWSRKGNVVLADVPGVADETGTLKEGEVFCQYQENDESMPRVVVSEVLVCRAPARESSIMCRTKIIMLTLQYILVS